MDRVSIFPHSQRSIDRKLSIPQPCDLGATDKVDDVVGRVGRRAGPKIGAQGGGIGRGKIQLFAGIDQTVVIEIRPGEQRAISRSCESQAFTGLPDPSHIPQSDRFVRGRAVGLPVTVVIMESINQDIVRDGVEPGLDDLVLAVDQPSIGIRIFP